MKTTPLVERRHWRGYRGSEHAWSAVRDLGMQSSCCGYLVRNARLTKGGARRCMLCVCIVDEEFATAPRDGPSAAARLRDLRRIRDHIRRAVQRLTATSLDATLSEAALLKMRAVESDLVQLFRLERLGTSRTADDESLSEAAANAASQKYTER